MPLRSSSPPFPRPLLDAGPEGGAMARRIDHPTILCEHMFACAGDEQRVENDLRLPGVGDGTVVRTFDAPEAMGVNFHEVRARSALNRVPGGRYGFSYTINPYRGCTHACVFTHRQSCLRLGPNSCDEGLAPTPAVLTHPSSSSSNVHSRGSLSSRKRRNLAPCRIRPEAAWSYPTSITSSGRSATHSRSRPPVHRLGSAVPLLPVSSGASIARMLRFAAVLKPEMWPTVRRVPSS